MPLWTQYFPCPDECAGGDADSSIVKAVPVSSKSTKVGLAAVATDCPNQELISLPSTVPSISKLFSIFTLPLAKYPAQFVVALVASP